MARQVLVVGGSPHVVALMCVCMSGVCSVCVVCDVCVSGVWSVCVMFVCVFVSRGWNVWVVLV